MWGFGGINTWLTTCSSSRNFMRQSAQWAMANRTQSCIHETWKKTDIDTTRNTQIGRKYWHLMRSKTLTAVMDRGVRSINDHNSNAVGLSSGAYSGVIHAHQFCLFQVTPHPLTSFILLTGTQILCIRQASCWTFIGRLQRGQLLAPVWFISSDSLSTHIIHPTDRDSDSVHSTGKQFVIFRKNIHSESLVMCPVMWACRVV